MPGARSAALGGNWAVGVPTAENLYANPALLTAFTNGLLAYEFDADVRFKGIRLDYRLRFDELSSLGVLFPPASNSAVRFGLAAFTLFRGEGSAKTVGEYGMVVRKLGVVAAFPLGRAVWVGCNAGVLVAAEGNSFALAPNAQVHAVWRPDRDWLFGAYVLTPALLDWRAWSGLSSSESTPAAADLGAQWAFARGWQWMVSLGWQGWDFVTYEKSGARADPARGGSAFDPFQDWFVKTALVHRSTGKLVDDPLDTEAEGRLGRLLREVEELRRVPGLREREDAAQALRRERERLQTDLEDLTVRRLTPEEEGRLAEALRLLRAKHEEWQTARRRSTDASAPDDERRRWLERLPALESERAKLQGAVDGLRTVTLDEAGAARADAASNRIRLLAANEEHARADAVRFAQADAARMAEARAARRAGRVLDPADEARLLAERQAEDKQAEITEIRRRLARPARRLNSLPKGDYFLSFRPSVSFQPDGSFQRRGQIGVGFSFRPANIDALQFNLALVDESLLRLVQAFPDNDFNEQIKVGAELSF